MDLKAYYKKIRAMERSLPTPSVFIASLGTPDGGTAGVVTEVPAAIGARMMVDGIARVATDEEIARFQKQNEAGRQAAEQIAAASKLQLVVVPASTANSLKVSGERRER